MKKRTEMIVREGFPFIFVSGAIFLLTLLSDAYLFWQLLFLFLTLFFTYFFRNPERIPDDSSTGVVLSPSDGEVISITEVKERFFTNKDMIKISIRLGFLDVHIQRSPIESKIENSDYIHGEFLTLSDEKASELNEQNRTLFVYEDKKVITNQIAGFVTRRIIPFVKKDDEVALGQRYGMIMFGSQVDIYVPKETNLKVNQGQKLLAGESIIGFFSE
jgi:phosphatidylserine decarboxylase